MQVIFTIYALMNQYLLCKKIASNILVMLFY